MVRYACAVCRKIIAPSQWVITLRPDGKLSMVAHCHGAQQEKLFILEASGVMFTEQHPSLLPTRYPEDYLDK